MRPTAPAAAPWGELSSLRWGRAAAAGDACPGGGGACDWRWEAANLPPDRWTRWRRLASELLEGRDDEPTAEDIRAADRAAYDLIRVEPEVLNP